jgi:hypothetical protein
MKSLGHNFIRHPVTDYLVCVRCELLAYVYSDDIVPCYAFRGRKRIDITCNEMIIKKLLE